MRPFFAALAAILQNFPLLVSEPGRIAATDESPLHQQTEKLKGVNKKVAFVPQAMQGRAARSSVVGDGSSHVSLLGTACADGKMLPNGYLVTGTFPKKA